ncbi:MurT ligase domain-containing protein [Thermogemmatispora tikiterensis]|uniref:MurT ligase domain-containing protein n=1 Tax=Thermogemmatispora tikiterensis TaxID=1825093 RepID=UPI000DD7295B|nr:MurT ligase domain-containing protein [Thermogemmatispora tikiterensis]
MADYSKHGGGGTSWPGRARLALAISAGKLAGASGRLFRIGGGTSLPGMIARRIDPNVLRSVMATTTAKKIVITGSNGKTTTARMTAAIADASGRRVSHNRTGSNLLQGVTSVVVNFADIFGRLDSDLLLFEIDEGTMPVAMPEIQPDVVVITNIFRDQLDRYGELYSVAKALDKLLESLPETATIVLNGNDPQVASFGQQARARKLYFGLRTTDVGRPVPEHAADVIRCIRCNEDLVYEVAYLSHLGLYRCPNCGYELPSLDVAATSIHLDPRGDGPTQVTMETPLGQLELTLPLPGVHNVYNAAAAVAASIAAGFGIEKVPAALSNIRTAFGRLEKIQAGDQTIYLAFVKNPTSFNLVLRLIAQHPGEKHLLLVASNTVVDGEDFAWLWDVDLEEISPQVADVICSGTKAEELAMRLKYAEVPLDRVRVIHEREAALDAALQNAGPGGTLYIMASYTPTQELRRIMQKRGWVKPYWEE